VRIPNFCKFQPISSTVSHVALHCRYKIFLRAAENTLVGYRLVPWTTVCCHGQQCVTVGYRVLPWATVSGLRQCDKRAQEAARCLAHKIIAVYQVTEGHAAITSASDFFLPRWKGPQLPRSDGFTVGVRITHTHCVGTYAVLTLQRVCSCSYDCPVKS
jgi:hypothetical protein